jgi:triphosphoribosyl-dephospho-CoA synthase
MVVNEPPPIGICAQAACILDVVTFKPGNVSIANSFADLNASDFLLSAAAIAPVLERAPLHRIGDTILDCIRETRKVTSTNANLGIVLLLAPLASVQPHLDLRGGIMRALMRLDVADARAAYEAIRLAQPGGLGTVAEQDISDEPTVTLREAMGLAADRDLVARQYVNDFEQVFEGTHILRQLLADEGLPLDHAVIELFLRFIAKYPDSLIARRHGLKLAEELSRRARHRAVSGTKPADALYWFDKWRRNYPGGPVNPGTTADLVVASLFVALRQNIIQLPLPKPPTG